MRGMKSLVAPTKRQNFADGGVVGAIKGMFGIKPEDPERARRLAEYQANAAREKEAAKAATAPAPAPAPAITDYAAGSALKRREAAAGLKDGGPVRGPGTGTSDDVPDNVPEGTYIMPTDSTQAIGEKTLGGLGMRGIDVNLSDGEFKLPPKQVHAIGVQALNQMKDATHTPSSTEAAKGMKPELFFEGGGVASEEERQKRLQNQTAMYVQGAQAAAAAAPVTPAAPAPAAPPAAPAAAASPPARAAGPSELYMADRAQEMGDQWKAGNYAGAVGTGLRTAVQGLGMYGIETADKALSPVIDASQRLIGGALGTDTPSGAVKPSTAAPVMPPAPVPAAAKSGLAGAPPAAPAPVSTQAPDNNLTTGNVTRVGNSYSGTNVAGDITVNGQAPRGGFMSTGDSGSGAARSPVGMTSEQAQREGLIGERVGYNPAYDQRLNGATGISAQNMAAADALAGRSQQESMNRIAARGMGALAGGPGSGPVEPGSFTGGFSGVIGTDPRIAQQERERSALASALSSPLRGAQNGQLTASQRQGMAGLLDAERRDASSNRQADQTAATQQSIAAMREAGDNGRAFLREDGENTRSTARNQIDSRRYNDEASARAVDMRAAQRRESAYDNYSKAKTDEDRQAIAKQFPDLFGQAKDAAHRMEVVRGKTDPMTGQSSGDYVVVQDPKTGGVRQIQMGAASAAPTQARAVGSVSTVNGKTAVWDGSKWVPR